jgi:hypothetical protein
VKPAALDRWLPPAAVALFGLGVALIIAVAGSTLGYDYAAYVDAGRRLMHGEPLYDTTASVAGGFALFLYPPPFAVAMIPFALLPPTAGTWLWIGGLLAAFLLGARLLPVRGDVRWAVILLAGLCWPFLYSVKLGQVGPLLFLAFAAGWRALDRPAQLGLDMTAGALIKVQPALLLPWAAVTGRWRAAVVGCAGIAVAALAVTPFVGTATWTAYVDLLRRVSAPVTTPHNFTPGAIAFQLGVAEDAANLVQLVSVGLTLAVAAWTWFRTDPETSYVTTVVATQLISPLLWDHYAMLLLLPTALLLHRRQWWAVLIPLAGWLPAPVIPILFGICLLAPAATRARGRPAKSTGELPART